MKPKKATFNYGNRSPLFDDAAELVVMHALGTVALLQRKLRLSFEEANALMGQLESAGIVGSFLGNQPRVVNFKTLTDLRQYVETLTA